MKTLLICLLLLVPLSVDAKEGFWVSHRVRLGYDQLFTGVQVELSGEHFLQTSVDTGVLWKLNDMTIIEPRYVLKLPKFNDNVFEHQARLSLKLTFK